MSASRKGLLDMTYACYTWVTFACIIMALISILPNTTAQVLAMVVGLPLTFVTIPALLAGVVLSFILWRERPLVVMAILSIVAVLLFILQEIDWSSSFMIEHQLIAVLSYPIVTIGYLVITLRWWLVVRKRRFPK